MKRFNVKRKVKKGTIRHPSISIFSDNNRAISIHNGEISVINNPSYFDSVNKAFNFTDDDVVVMISGWVYFDEIKPILRRLKTLALTKNIYFFVEDVYRIIRRKFYNTAHTFDTYMIENEINQAGAMELELIQYMVKKAKINEFRVFSGELYSTYFEEKYGFKIEYYDWFLAEQAYIGLEAVSKNLPKGVQIEGRQSIIPFSKLYHNFPRKDIINREWVEDTKSIISSIYRDKLKLDFRKFITTLDSEISHQGKKVILQPLDVVMTGDKFLVVNDINTYTAYEEIYNILEDLNDLEKAATMQVKANILGALDRNFKYKALCLNGRFDWHRYLLSAMIVNCQDLGLTLPYREQNITLKGNLALPFNKFSKETQEEILKNNEEKILENEYWIDYRHDTLYDENNKHQPLELTPMMQQESILFYQKSFLAVATETRYYSPMPYVSEKTIKACAVMRPFIIAGAPGSLKLMKELGFKTFDKWIDESYDKILNHNQRLEMIAKEIKRICAMPKADLQKMLVQMEDILIHNAVNLKYLPQRMIEFNKRLNG